MRDTRVLGRNFLRNCAPDEVPRKLHYGAVFGDRCVGHIFCMTKSGIVVILSGTRAGDPPSARHGSRVRQDRWGLHRSV